MSPQEAEISGVVRLTESTAAPPLLADSRVRLGEISREPRVVFVNRYFYPDVSATSQMLSDLAFRLVQQGIEVHVMCSDALYENAAAKLPTAEVIQGVYVHRVWTSHFGRGRLYGRAIDYASFYVTATVKLLGLLRAGDTVVAKTDPPLISIAAAAVAKARGAHLVNWLQDVFPEVASHLGANPLPAWLDNQLKKLRDHSLRRAKANIVVGTRMREHLEQRSISGERIRVIENWADGDAVTPKQVEACELRARLGLADKFVIAYSGNLGRAHEFDTLLAAAERLRSDDHIVFLMIGGGAKMELLQSAAAAKQLPNFRFLPYQPRELLSDSLAAADVHLACLLPPLEGLIVPSKFYGILAAGRPVIFIGDADGELGRIIRHTQCGSAIAIGDADGLVDIIHRYRADPLLREQMGARARTLFIEKYTVARATRQWLEVLAAGRS